MKLENDRVTFRYKHQKTKDGKPMRLVLQLPPYPAGASPNKRAEVTAGA